MQTDRRLMGYHKRKIPKGKYREFSKIKEEMLEAIDAHEQGVEIMLLTELSDLYGAIQGYLEKYHPNITMNDLKIMNERTTEAFKDGTRKTNLTDE